MMPMILLAAALGSGTATPDTLADLDWLSGTWLSEMGDRRIEEHWTPPAGGTMLGLSRTIAGDRTVGFEFLRIERRPEGIFYIAHPNGAAGTEFALTRLEDREAVFENPQHDHPKIIRYRREAEESLVATIEGDETGRHVRQEFRYRMSRH